MSNTKNEVQTVGKKKTSIAVATCTRGTGTITVNGRPVERMEPKMMLDKVLEPVQILGQSRFEELDVAINVRGGGDISKIYAVRQAIAKAIVAYYQKYVDEVSKDAIKRELLSVDRSLLVADPRRAECKKYGGPGARARYQKSYR